MTLLVASIAASTPEQAAADLAAAVAAGADAIELRADCLRDADDVVIRSIAALRPAGMPLILTIRAADEGGAWDGNEVERLSRLIALAPAAEYIDVELATWQRSANVRQKIGLARGHADGRRSLILSVHDFTGRPRRLLNLLAELYEQDAADVVKVAWHARTLRDNFECFDLLRAAVKPLSAICLGRFGQPSRILAPKFAAFATYAAAAEDRPAAPGQLSVAELRQQYRCNLIGPATRVFGLVGWPVEHSLGPAVHNVAFAHDRLDAVYLPFPVEPSYESFKALMVEVLARPWLDLTGLSITLPHKENALRFIREHGGCLAPPAERVGAVNTIKVNSDGSLAATNTDLPAALDAVLQLMGGRMADLQGLRCSILGAGGVARAIVAGLVDAEACVTVFNRSEERARRLAGDFGCAVRPWSERAGAPSDLIVNCTPVGMWPDTAVSPLPRAALRRDVAIFDTIYRPARTQLLADAAARGCRTADGLSMFVDQAARQFEFWLDRPAPRAVLQQAAVRGVSERETP